MASNYPVTFDNDSNLYQVRDNLRVVLAEDYNPGDTSIIIEDLPQSNSFSQFPNSGVLTLTEQCSEVSLRAISFSYTGKGANTFTGLTLLSGFTDCIKQQRITDVTLNVVAESRNQIKDAVIAIENFVGVKDDMATSPLQGSVEARTNFMRKLVLQPKSWFSADRNIGIVPLCINIADLSTRNPNVWKWDFGDGTTSTISRTSAGQIGSVNKCYYTPSIYNVTLTTTNDFGSDTITLPAFVTARTTAPDLATITFQPTNLQIYQDGVLRSRANQLISVLVVTNGQQLLDPITSYVWEFNDDLSHDPTNTAVAEYALGGLYDVKLHTETYLGAYRTTLFPNVINIVEQFNIWHFIFDPNAQANAVTKTLYAYEFDLLSELYKTAHSSTALPVTRNTGFLNGVPDQTQQTNEFLRNNGFAPRSLTASGDSGASIVFWSEGSANPGSQLIRLREFNGFQNTWTTPSSDNISRQWNWLALNSGTNVYFILGSTYGMVNSPTNQNFASLDVSNYSVSSIPFTSTNYLSGATELMNNVGSGSGGDFSVYRGTWGNSNGYFVRNDGIGTFFRIKSFYTAGGTITTPLQTITKLPDMPGYTKFEGQMTTMSQGIYFFNNTGEVLLYNPTTNVWSVGGPGVNSPIFTALQDTNVNGYSNAANTLLATSDQSTKTYLFFDYSVRAQMEFDESTLTFTSLPVRPYGEQFVAGLY